MKQFKDVDYVQQDLKRIEKKLQRMQSNLAKQKTSTENGEVRKSYSGSKTSENLYDTPEHFKPDSEREWSAFNRQFANKTSDLKNGQKDDIMITTADNVYFVRCNGYLSGKIILKENIDGNEEFIKAFEKEFINGTISNTKGLNSTIQSIRNEQRPSNRNNVNVEKSSKSKVNDGVDKKPYVSNDRTSNIKSGKPIQNEQLTQADSIESANFMPQDTRKSLNVDSQGNTLTEAQQEYFKDSKVRDDNGNLLVMYQGALNEFYKFDRKKSSSHNLYGKGFYFTDSKSRSEMYGNSRAYYLNIKNPIATYEGDNVITKPQLLKFLQAIEQDGEDYDLYNYGENATPESVLKTVWGKSDFAMIQDINAAAIGDLVAAIELFNEVNGTNFDGIILATETITFTSNQAKLTTNENPTENEDIRYSKNIDISKLEEKHQTLQDEYNSLNKEVEEIKNSEEYKKFVDDLSTISPGEELDELIKEYGRWQHKVGLYKKSKRMSEIIGEQKDIRAIIEDDNKNSREAFMLSIENLDDNEKLEYVNKAVERYGTTNNVKLASYLLLNGDMLDFSSGQGYRVQDHREISEILDMPESAEYSDGLIAFMNMGNIRLQTYGIDISQAPNNEQKSTLRDIISQVMRANDEFTVDFSKTSGYTDGSVTYPKGTSSSKILADIDSYFKDGVVPEYASSIADYRYSKNIDLSNVEDYENRYLYKKPIKVSKQEWSAINSRRTQRYGDKSENEMPSVDFFIVGTYNNLNKGFEYYIVNYDKYSFSVVAKKKLKDYGVVNNNDTRRKTNLETTRDGLQEGLYSGNNISNRDGRRGGKNAYSYEEQPQNDRPTVNNGGGSDGRVFTSTEDRRKSLNIDLTTLPDSELSDAVENETITKEQAEQELMRRYGKIPNSFKPKQNIVLTVEETQKEGFATSEFVDNVLRNGKFDADMTDEQKAEILKAAKAHKIITDKAALKRVETALANNYEGAVAEWQSYINVNNKSIKQIGKNEIALGQQLLQHAAENGNVADTVKYLAELTEAATRAGQTVQAFYVLKIF